MSRSPITIEGNVTGDVRDHTFNDGTRVANFTVAVNSRKKNQRTNEYEEVGVQFFDCIAPNHLVDAVLMNVSKGVPLVVSGSLDFRDWTSKDGSSKGTALEIRVERIGYSIRFHDVQGMKRQRGGGGGGGSYYGQPQAGQAQSEWGQPAVQQQAPPQANWGQPAAPPATQGNPWANTPPAPPAQQQQFGGGFDDEQPF